MSTLTTSSINLRISVETLWISRIHQQHQKRSELETALSRNACNWKRPEPQSHRVASSAERMLKSIEHKLGTFEDVNDIMAIWLAIG